MKNNQSGRSMVEMLGVLAIIGVLSAGGLAGYSKAMFKHKLNATMDQITMLVTNIRTMYGTQGNYEGLSKSAAVDLGIVPAVMTDDVAATSTASRNVTLTNPFKGNVDITTFKADGSTDDTGFKLTYGDLPSEACIALATADFGSGAGSGFIGVEVSGGAYKTATVIGGTSKPGDVTYSEGSALQMSDAITACQGQTKTVVWYFY